MAFYPLSLHVADAAGESTPAPWLIAGASTAQQNNRTNSGVRNEARMKSPLLFAETEHNAEAGVTVPPKIVTR
jgi:hypothetical protein